MSTERVIFSILFLSVHIAVIQCESDDKTNDNLQNSKKKFSNDEWADLDSIMDLPFKLIMSDLGNQIPDEIKDMENKMNDDLWQEFDGFPDLTLFNRLPSILPIREENQFVPVKASHQSGNIRDSKSTSRTDAQQNEIFDKSKLLKSLLNSFESSGNEELHVEKLNNSSGIPSDNESINKNFRKLILPVDLSRLSGFGNQPMFNITSDTEPNNNMGQFYFVELGSNDQIIPDEKQFQTSFSSANIMGPRRISISENEQSSSLHRIMGDFAQSMQNMMNTIRETFSKVSLDNELMENKNSTEEVPSKLNISIHYHGANFFVPSNAYMNSNKSGLVNITWKSETENFNNSLCFKLSKVESGNIIFQHVHLKIMKDNEMHEYMLDKPKYFETTKGITNGTIIQLSDKVGVRFFSSEFLDVVAVDMTENYSNHWLAFSIAILGLIVAGLIMLLSYILHKRNQTFARKGSLSKEAIVY